MKESPNVPLGLYKFRLFLFKCHDVSFQEAPAPTKCGRSRPWQAKLPRQSIDLLLLDPPYNLNKRFGDNTF